MSNINFHCARINENEVQPWKRTGGSTIIIVTKFGNNVKSLDLAAIFSKMLSKNSQLPVVETKF